MKKAFDEQVHKIFIFLDREFEKLQMSHPGETVVSHFSQLLYESTPVPMMTPF
jgi:hypothetical protein